jgi:non-ribosomal peptide synthase protein (TIGR01720 family)
MGGRLELSWQYGPAHRRETAEALARELGQELRALIEHCTSDDAGGRTASDFSFVDIDQETLELIEDQLLSGD